MDPVHHTCSARPILSISMINNKAARTSRSVRVRVMHQSAMRLYNVEITNCLWKDVITANSAHEKAFNFQTKYAHIVEKCFPQKQSECQMMTAHGGLLNYKLFLDKRKSLKWLILEKQFQAKKKIPKKLTFLHKVGRSSD